MNLHDLLRRKDRDALVEGGEISAVELKRPGGSVRVVEFLREGSVLVVRGASRASSLFDYPESLGWSLLSESRTAIVVEMRSEAGLSCLARIEPQSGVDVPVRLRWPVPVPVSFDLVVRSKGAGALLAVGPLFDSRRRVLEHIHGVGVEVGPGLTPAVLPGPSTDVSYVERKHPADWARTYAKRDLSDDETRLWDRYVVDSADRLNRFDPGSLDFIFSSHVIEHLVDPIGVFQRWWEKLKVGGVVAGVVPDARFTFDWKQPLQQAVSLEQQRGLAADEPTEEMYVRWCTHTSPENTPESLRARDYSIHVNYYTPTLFREMIGAAIWPPERRSLFLHSVANGKDFAFLVRKDG
jgi:hypothetical protein